MVTLPLLFMGMGSFEMLLILFLPLAITLWALIDTVKSNFKNDTNKLVWIIVIIGMPLLGGILYFLIGTKQKSTV
jgi:peptidoglycan/LPS O-acetylase OafA/YrhL